MSVVPMRLVTLAGPMPLLDVVTQSCVIDQEFQPEHAMRLMHDVQGLRPCDATNPYAPLLRRLEILGERIGLTPRYTQPRLDAYTLEDVATYLDETEGTITELQRHHDELEQAALLDKAAAQELENLHGLAANLEELRNLHYLRFRYGRMPRETYDSFIGTLSQREDTFFFVTRITPTQVYCIYFTTKRVHDEVDALFNSLHFSRIMLDERAAGTADDAIDAFSQRAQESLHQAEDLDSQLAALRLTQCSHFGQLWSWTRFQNDLREIRRYAVHSKEAFYLMGWVPATHMDALYTQLAQFKEVSFVSDNAADIAAVTPPTKLKNNFFARIFEPFLRMYGLPAYNELDPSLFMAITYTLFFGIMFGDVGQGLCMAILGVVLTRWKKMWLGNIITCCGLASAVAGCFYGSVFGFEHILPGFKILEESTLFPGSSNVMILLIGSLALGVLMLVAVMGLNIINGIKQRNFEKIFFGPNGVAGIVFYLGIIFAAVSQLLWGRNLFVPAYVLPVLALPLVMMFLKEPLGKLLSGDPSWKHVELGELLGVGFFELFETLLSYLTNTLSFLRIGAYAITHVGLMMVIQMLAGSNLNPVMIVLGNIFVMGFEGLLVGIQVLRLDFYELFGRFYSDGGVAYHPMVIPKS